MEWLGNVPQKSHVLKKKIIIIRTFIWGKNREFPLNQ